MSGRRSDKEDVVKGGPFEWLFNAALLVLGTAIALTLALQLLAAIWPWLVAGALVIGGAALAIRIAILRRRQW